MARKIKVALSGSVITLLVIAMLALVLPGGSNMASGSEPGEEVQRPTSSSEPRGPAADGSSWTLQTSGTREDLSSVAFVDANTGWAVGWNTILKTTDGGATWTPQNSGTDKMLFNVHFVDASHGWAVGSGLTILHTWDGGANWFRQSGDTNFLYDVTIIASSLPGSSGGL